MDMPTPSPPGSNADHKSRAKLDELAKALGCSADLFFRTPSYSKAADAAQLLQMWLAIRCSEGRHTILTLVRELTKSQTR